MKGASLPTRPGVFGRDPAAPGSAPLGLGCSILAGCGTAPHVLGMSERDADDCCSSLTGGEDRWKSLVFPWPLPQTGGR